MKTLDELAVYYQTDRASVFTRTYGKPHGYAVHYDKLFTPLRREPIKLLEIGVGGGEGIKMWLDYFENDAAWIYGVDTVSGTNDYDTDGKVDRYCFHQGDQCDPKMWERFIEDVKGGFDIIIDDGLHSNIAVITTFNALWQHVKPGGFYAIEDLNVAYNGPSFFVSQDWPDQVSFLKGKIDELNQGGEIDSIYWAKEICIIKKATK
jgi:hypothetical protein